MAGGLRWDLFCRVVDNHGDAGVCWRLAAELARRGHAVRLWIDDASALAGMAPAGEPGVDVLPWPLAEPGLEPGDVVIEAFGCDPPDAFVARMAAARAAGRALTWLNLEYLSAEAYVERSHGLPSPVSSGPGAGLTKYFFYPGFTPRTGGLLREQDLVERQRDFDAAAWLPSIGIDPGAGRCVSLFCYEPAALPQLLRQLAAGERTQLLVTPGRATAATRAALAQLDARDAGWNRAGQLALHFLPFLPQRDYDQLLWSCALNFVRGEDSVVRALLAGRPFVWHIYPQQDDAHGPKLEAFLRWLDAPDSLSDFHRTWNAEAPGALPPIAWVEWEPTAQAARQRALALPELADGLERFATARGRI